MRISDWSSDVCSSDLEPEIVAAAPAAFTEAERAVFIKLVRAAGEVGGNALATNVTNAKALVVLRCAGNIQGIAALKRPQGSYRKRIGSKANADLAEASFQYELGYIFLFPEARGGRKRVVEGKKVSVRVDPGGRR